MNSVTEFIYRLQAQNVRIWLEDDQLRYRAPDGALPNSLQEALMNRRSEIIPRLRSQEVLALSPAEMPRDRQACPLSSAQRRLWFLEQFERAGYHGSIIIRLQAGAGGATVQQALDQLVARHDALRTTFHLDADGPWQRIHRTSPIALQVHDVSAEKEPLKVAQALAMDYIRRPFDPETGPLFRAGLILLDAEESCLLLVLHQLIADDWSLGILQRELMEFVRAGMTSTPAELAPVERHHADHVWMQKGDEFEARISRHLTYWRKRLAGADAGIALPTDFPRPAVRSLRGRLFTTALPAAVGERLRTFCAAQGLTPFAVLLAAFKVLIFRLGGQRDISLGTPVANRRQPEWAGVVGCFANMLVLRTQIDPAEGFGDYARREEQIVSEAFEHEECPFERIVEDLGVPRDLSRHPLFQILFALHAAVESEAKGGTGGQSRLRLPGETARFDLSISLSEADGAFQVDCEYATSLFTENSIARLFRRYACVLESLLDHPQRPVSEAGVMEAEERAQLVRFATGPIKNYATTKSIPELVAEKAMANPSAPAVKFGDNELTYGELDWHSDNLAAVLQRLEIGPGDTCALCMEPSVAMVRAILAILKVGAAYLPLDPDLRAGQIDFMIADSRPRLLLTQPHLAPKFAESGLEVIECPEDGAEIPNIFPKPHQANLLGPAYVLYTPDSTNQPKAVINHQRALINQFKWMQDFHPIGPGDSVLQTSRCASDVSVWEILWPLICGARLVLAAPGKRHDPARLQGVIAREQITVIHFVPSFFRRFLQAAKSTALKSLRAVFCSGEALSAEVVAQFQALGLRSCLYYLYGPTDAAIDVAMWDCAAPTARAELMPIGRPIANLETWLLDEGLDVVPLGMPGEICLGGAGLATGYLNRPHLTAESFVPHPFSKEAGARLYRTGDLGRFLPGGSIEYLGRVEHQVKLHSQRLDLGAIEKALLRLPAVDQAAVVLAQADGKHPCLVGYVVASTPFALESEWKGALREELPGLLIPARLIRLETLPLKADGSVDRHALATRPVESAAAAGYIAPAESLECLISTLWSKLLAIDGVGVTQDFFELGGNSMLMACIHRRLVQRLKQEFPLAKLFVHSTVRSLARYLQGEGLKAPNRNPVTL